MPFFMIGTQRSGSNLLRLMINQLPDVAAPHPPHILDRMVALSPHYGDLADDWRFGELVDDTCRLVEKNPVAWEGVTLDRTDIAARCSQRSVEAVHGAIYDTLADSWGARDWCCKSLANVHYLDGIEACFGDRARYIHLYRDGRDVALSFLKAVVGEKHWYHIARQWDAEQRKALALKAALPAERFMGVSYEALTTQPEQVLQRLCEFIGCEYSPEMMNFHCSAEASRTAKAGTLWQNVQRPVQKDNSKKFLTEAKPEQVRLFEAVAGESLRALGYPLHFLEAGDSVAFTPEVISGFDADNELLKAEAAKRADPDEVARRRPQATLLQDIEQRLQARQSALAGLQRAA